MFWRQSLLKSKALKSKAVWAKATPSAFQDLNPVDSSIVKACY